MCFFNDIFGLSTWVIWDDERDAKVSVGGGRGGQCDSVSDGNVHHRSQWQKKKSWPSFSQYQNLQTMIKLYFNKIDKTPLGRGLGVSPGWSRLPQPPTSCLHRLAMSQTSSISRRDLSCWLLIHYFFLSWKSFNRVYMVHTVNTVNLRPA